MQHLSELYDLIKRREPAHIVVVKAACEHVVDAIVPAVERGWVHPIFIDDATEMERVLAGRLPAGSYQIIDEGDPVLAAQRGVDLVREGRGNVLMKGTSSTGVFLKPVVNKETGIRASALLSHVAVVEARHLDRLLILTDGGMVPQPGKEELPAIIEHARQVADVIGAARDKVALLSAAETVIPRLTSSVMQAQYAAEHEGMEGPISLDIATFAHIAEEKRYPGNIQGDASVIVAPDIVSCNSLVKSLVLFGEGAMAGVVCGASVPIVLTSRSASDTEKFASIALALALAGE